MASFTTGLTGWLNKSRSSVFLIICTVCVGIVGNFNVGVRVCLTTTIIVVQIVGPIGVISGLVYFSFEWTALIPIVTWLLAMVASWFGLFGVLLCRLMRHSVYLQFIGGFQTIRFHFPSKIRTILFIRAIFQVRLVD